MRTFTLTLISLLLVVASCGGDSDDDAAGGSSGGGSVEDWCPLAEEFEALGDSFDLIDPTDPDAVRGVFEEATQTLDQARSTAPSEISDDVGEFADAFGEFDSILSGVDYNLFDADLSQIEEIGNRIDSAGDSIEAFNERECGIEADDSGDTEDDSDDLGFDPEAGTLRDQFADTLVEGGFSEDEANCIADNADITALAAEDTTALFEVFETCEIDLARLAELGG